LPPLPPSPSLPPLPHAPTPTTPSATIKVTTIAPSVLTSIITSMITKSSNQFPVRQTGTRPAWPATLWTKSGGFETFNAPRRDPHFSAGRFAFFVSDYGGFFKTTPAGRVQIAWKSYSPVHAWTTIGNTALSFSLSPSCAALDGAYDSGGTRNKQIAVLARGPNLGRYWIAIWKLGNSGGFGEVRPRVR
jgi:hypothetical protein